MNFMKSDRSTEPVIPKMTEVSSEYGEIIKLQEELNVRMTRHIAEMKEIARHHGNMPPAFAPAVKGDTAEATGRLAKLLNGFAPAATSTVDSRETDGIRFYDLYREVEDIQEKALPLLAEKCRAAALEASRVICERVEDRHRAIVREMAATLRELHEVNVRYCALADPLTNDGVSWGRLGPSFFHSIGRPTDASSALARWFKDAAAAGHINRSEIPETLR